MLIGITDNFYKENPSIREFPHKSIKYICRKENVSHDRLFSVLFWFSVPMTCCFTIANQKLKNYPFIIAT